MAAGFVVWIICLIANIAIASKRNKPLGKWIVLSIFFSWITLIVNIVMMVREN